MAKERRGMRKVVRANEVLREAKIEAAAAKRALEAHNDAVRSHAHPQARGNMPSRIANENHQQNHQRPPASTAEYVRHPQEDRERIRQHSAPPRPAPQPARSPARSAERTQARPDESPAAAGEGWGLPMIAFQYRLLALWMETCTRMMVSFWFPWNIDANTDRLQ